MSGAGMERTPCVGIAEILLSKDAVSVFWKTTSRMVNVPGVKQKSQEWIYKSEI
jgi:hypothetical protein